MTLTKAIEAAREAMQLSSDRLYVSARRMVETPFRKEQEMYAWESAQALATLPDKPMTEEEVFDLIDKEVGIKLSCNDIADIIKALKAHNVLYVSEEK